MNRDSPLLPVLLSSNVSVGFRIILLNLLLQLRVVQGNTRGGGGSHPRGGIYGFGIIGGPPAVTVTFFFGTAILFVGCTLGAYLCYRYQQRKNWNQRVDDAEENVYQKALTATSGGGGGEEEVTSSNFLEGGCTYNAVYKERDGSDCHSKGTLEFTINPTNSGVDDNYQSAATSTVKKGEDINAIKNNESQNKSDIKHKGCSLLSIVGHGANQNGGFVIKRGYIDATSGYCYLVEETTSENKKRWFHESKQILMTGIILSKNDKEGNTTTGTSSINFQQGRWASYHDWGWVTDGTIDRFDLSLQR